jgi:hypothetical protein
MTEINKIQSDHQLSGSSSPLCAERGSCGCPSPRFGGEPECRCFPSEGHLLPAVVKIPSLCSFYLLSIAKTIGAFVVLLRNYSGYSICRTFQT